jgi:hypothetical protein
MLEANVPAKVVQDVLGHADVTLTLNTYSHVIGSTAHEQIAKINGLFQLDNAESPQPVDKPSIKSKINGLKERQNAVSGKPSAKLQPRTAESVRKTSATPPTANTAAHAVTTRTAKNKKMDSFER